MPDVVIEDERQPFKLAVVAAHVELETMSLGEQHDGRVQVEEVIGIHLAFAAELRFHLAVGRGVETVGRLLEREEDPLRIPSSGRADASISSGAIACTVLHYLTALTREPYRAAIKASLGLTRGDAMAASQIAKSVQLMGKLIETIHLVR